MKEIIINGENAVLGRVASYAAKMALKGRNVVVVNCEKTVVSGNPRITIDTYKQLRKKGGSSQRGPYFPRVPEKIVKRTIRGMVPYKQQRGRDALKRVMCYDGVPDKYKDAPMIKTGREKVIKTLEMREITKEL